MDDQSVRQVARLLRERNVIDAKITQVTGGPVAPVHLGEWIASQIFDIQLDQSASAPGIGGRFRSGPLQGRAVNVQWHLNHEGLLDTSGTAALDYYLVLAGPPSTAGSSPEATRAWCIDSVFLFDASQLRSEQESVTPRQWRAAEVYPSARNSILLVTPNQAALLQQFLVA